jgi:hypothetical protein
VATPQSMSKASLFNETLPFEDHVSDGTAPRVRMAQVFHSKVALQHRPLVPAEYRHTSRVAVVRVESSILGATMKSLQCVGTVFLLSALGCLVQSPARAARDGQHDFDFSIGTWTTHISRLQNPLTGSTTWVEYDGVSVVREILNGHANLFELTADGPAGHIEGVGLRLYNPRSHQWSLNWTNGQTGILGVPTIGKFENGRGVFVDQELFNDRVILVRNSFMDITPDSARFEQTFSDDAGSTWETNWVMTFNRLKAADKPR